MSNKSHHISSDGRDERIGRFLAEGIIRRENDCGPCLTDEELAALLDGSLAEQQQDRCMEHLASCSRCRQVWDKAVTLEQPVRHRPVMRYLAPLGAVVVMVIGILLFRQGQSPQQIVQAPPVVQPTPADPSVPTDPSNPSNPAVSPGPAGPTSPAAPSERPAEPRSMLALAEIILNEKHLETPPTLSSRSYGFTGSLAPHRAAFRSGMALIDLAAAINQKDTLKRVEAVQLLSTLTENAQELSGLKTMAGKQLPDHDQYVALLTTLEHHVKIRNQLAPFRLGMLVQAGRRADDDRVQELLDGTTLGFLAKNLTDEQASPAVTNVLSRLQTYLVPEKPATLKIKPVRRLLDELAELY